MQTTITPNLWFDGQAEEAANFYCSIFPNSRIVSVARYRDIYAGVCAHLPATMASSDARVHASTAD